MSTVSLCYFNGAALVTRELTKSQDCPKCLSFESVALADMAYIADGDGLFASQRLPVRCRLCETEFARVHGPNPLRVTLDETVRACETARNNLGEVDARRRERALREALRAVHNDRAREFLRKDYEAREASLLARVKASVLAWLGWGG